MYRQHPPPTSPLAYAHVHRIRKTSTLRRSSAERSDTTHDIDETIKIISFSSQSKMTRSTLLTTQMIQKSLTPSSPSRTATDRSGTKQRFQALF